MSLYQREQLSAQNRAEVNRLTTDIANEVITNTQNQLEIDDINFTGGMSKSVHLTEVGPKKLKAVDVDSPYAIPVEFGMPKGIRVNFDALKKWVRWKLNVYDEPELTRVTAKIQNKILSKGIKPKRFFKKAIKALIARRGVIKSSGNSRTRSRFEKLLNKAVKTSRKISKISKKITKNINTFNRIRKP